MDTINNNFTMNSNNQCFMSENSIFQNRPPYTYYNQTFKEANDILYYLLNDINPQLLEEEDELENAPQAEETIVKDPRNNQPINKYLHDFTNETSLGIFDSPIKTKLSRKQHALGLRALQAKKKGQALGKPDLPGWCKMQPIYQQECEQMQKFVKIWAQKHKAKIYEPMQFITTLYKDWYEQVSNQLLKSYVQDMPYNTQTAFPLMRLCKPLDVDLTASIGEVHVINSIGWLESDFVKPFQYKVLRKQLPIFAKAYNESLTMNVPFFRKDYILELLRNISQEDEIQNICFFIPLETLLFLLLAGEYIDLPTEVFFQIISGSGGKKILYFEQPLPARNCGWHTTNQIIEQTHRAQLSMDIEMKWCDIKNQTDAIQPEVIEITGKMNEGDVSYKLQEFESYMHMKSRKTHIIKRNESLISWQLQTYADGTNLNSTCQILTTLQQTFHNYNIKVEHKSSYGCEVMSKYELLKSWLQLSLLDHKRKSCVRLDCETLELVLLESLTLEEIEEKLKINYLLDMPQILVKFNEFLKLFKDLKDGEYLLRYNYKYNDKLLVCGAATTITANTIFLHKLLKTIPSDIFFMTDDAQFLPLDKYVCSIIQEKNVLLPCTFPHGAQQGKKKVKKLKKCLLFNDRKLILDRRKKEVEQNQKNHKRIHKARRRRINRQKKAQKKEVTDEEDELDKEIENNALLNDLF